MAKVFVVGGSGFIGQAIQKYALTNEIADNFVFSYNKHPDKIHVGLEKIKVDFLDGLNTNVHCVKSYSQVIYVAGSSDQNLASRTPSIDVDVNIKTFLRFMQGFEGSLVLLSSQAVYDDLKGQICESVDHVATKPYAISKQAVESYARYFLDIGQLSKLWIFRAKHIFGEGEKKTRLIPRCARAVVSEEPITIVGEGKTVLSSLPSIFVAEILVKAAKYLEAAKGRFFEVTNINYPAKITTTDVVKFLQGIQHFDSVIKKSVESFPVRFWGDTKKLSGYLRSWRMEFPNLWEVLENYFIRLIRRYSQ